MVIACLGVVVAAGCGRGSRDFDWHATASADPNWAFAADVDPEGQRIFVGPVELVRNRAEPLGSFLNPHTDVQAALDAADDGDAVLIAQGGYRASPIRAIDPLGGNLPDAECLTQVPVTVGFRVRSACSVIGAGAGKTILHTGAGYGILIENLYDPEGMVERMSVEERTTPTRLPRRIVKVPEIRALPPVVIRGLTVTGGIRDVDARATSGAIVVRNAHVQVADCDIVANNGQPEGLERKYPGVIGVCAREGSHVAVANCMISGNSWDGIAAYRSHPEHRIPATIGVVRTTIKGGLGVGINVMWDARARIREVAIHGCWKGIGSFGQTEVVVENSLVYGQLGWGIVASNDSRMAIVGCVVRGNGTTGIARWSAGADLMVMNTIITANGRADREWVGKRVGLWLEPGLLSPNMRHNAFWDNTRADVGHGGMTANEDNPVTPIYFDGEYGNRLEIPEFLPNSWQLGPGSALADKGDPFTDQRLAAWLAQSSFTVPAIMPGRAGELSTKPVVRPIGIPVDAKPGCTR